MLERFSVPSIEWHGCIVPPANVIWDEIYLTQPPCVHAHGELKATFFETSPDDDGDDGDEFQDEWVLTREFTVKIETGIKLKHILRAAFVGVDTGKISGVDVVERTEYRQHVVDAHKQRRKDGVPWSMDWQRPHIRPPARG